MKRFKQILRWVVPFVIAGAVGYAALVSYEIRLFVCHLSFWIFGAWLLFWIYGSEKE